MTATCQACVKAVIDLGIEEEDRKRTWIADADEAIKRGSVETARAIYSHALYVFPGKKSIWRRAAQLEKAKGTRDSLDAILKKAVTYCPQVNLTCFTYSSSVSQECFVPWPGLTDNSMSACCATCVAHVHVPGLVAYHGVQCSSSSNSSYCAASEVTAT